MSRYPTIAALVNDKSLSSALPQLHPCGNKWCVESDHPAFSHVSEHTGEFELDKAVQILRSISFQSST